MASFWIVESRTSRSPPLDLLVVAEADVELSDHVELRQLPPSPKCSAALAELHPKILVVGHRFNEIADRVSS